MPAIANYSVPDLGALKQKPEVGLAPNANMIVAKPYQQFSVPPTNHVWVASSAPDSFPNVMASATPGTTRRWVGMGGTPLVGYSAPSGTPPFVGMIAIDTVTQTAYLSINNSGSAGDWINVTGSGAGTAI
jgi:hypothetical protein